MSRHYSLRRQRFDLEFRPASKASAHGGQLAPLALLEEFGLHRRRQQHPALDPRADKNHGFDPAVYVVSFLVAFTSGGISLADVERLNEDEPLKTSAGLVKVPDQSALGEWLRAIGEPGWLALRQITRELVAWTLAKAQPARYLQADRLECFFDDTQIEVSGKWFEGAGELLWRHAFVTCEDRAGTAPAAFERHRLKGDWERRLSELLSDLDLHHPPCQNWMANRCLYALATLAYDLLQALQLIYLPAAQTPRRVRTLIGHLLLVPVEMVRHARRLKACLYVPAGWVAWWRGLLAELLAAWRQLGKVSASG